MHQLDHLSTHSSLEFYSSFKKSALPKLKVWHHPASPPALTSIWACRAFAPLGGGRFVYSMCVFIASVCTLRSVFIGGDECVCLSVCVCVGGVEFFRRRG